MGSAFWGGSSVVVALLAAVIAGYSYAVNREKLRLDLFDRRFKIFEGARRLVSAAMQEAHVTREALWAFRAEMIGKEFLFSEHIVSYLDEMDRHAVRAWTMHIAIGQHIGAAIDQAQVNERERTREQFRESITWLTEQLQHLHARFSPDMRVVLPGVFSVALSSKWKEVWFPGLVFMVAGALLGWGITYKDTQTQIAGLQHANDALHAQDATLHQQYGMLQSQTKALQGQTDLLKRTQDSLTALFKTVAAAKKDVDLAINRRGEVTVQGAPIIDSQGHPITDEQGRFLTTDSNRVTADSPRPIN